MSLRHDAFFSYNWRDRTRVEGVARALREQELGVFLDRWYLVPGRPWVEALEEALSASRSVLVFLGPHGMGSWQQREKELALDLQTRRSDFSVIPVLLPGAEPALGFLSLNTWVDLRGGTEDERSLAVLAAAVLGQALGDSLEAPFEAPAATVCPYRGLQPFREEDAPFFLGRERFTDRLIDMVGERSLVAVVGASGSGKSSAVRAGLVPRLRGGSAGCTWEVATLVPTDRPFQALAAALVPLLEPGSSEVDQLAEASKLARHLDEGGVALRDVAGSVLETQPGTDRLLLVIDQLEEIYTLAADEKTRRRFFDVLLEAAASGPLSVVLTIRGDFYGHLLGEQRVADRLQDSVLNLGPMTHDELRKAVEEPARSVGLAFEKGLVERILSEVAEEPGHLPLLEFLLSALWDARQAGQLTHEAYEEIGGVRGAVARRAEEVVGHLEPAELVLVKKLSLRLVQPGSVAENTRRRAGFEEIDEAARPLLRQLADARLVVTARDPLTGEVTVEVAHEALIEKWDRLKDWLDDDREFLLWRHRLQDALAAWEYTKRDSTALLRGKLLAEARHWLGERQEDLSQDEKALIEASLEAWAARQRRRRNLMLSTWAAAATFLVVAVWAVRQWRNAEELRHLEQSRRMAREAEGLLERRADLALLLSVEATRIRETAETRRSLLDTVQSSDRLTTFLTYGGDSVYSLSFTPDGRHLGVGRQDGSLEVWDVETGEVLFQTRAHDSRVWCLAFSPDGRELASGGTDSVVRLWDVSTGRERFALTGHDFAVNALAWRGDGRQLASGAEDGTLLLWDAESGQAALEPLVEHEDAILALTYGGDGSLISVDEGGLLLFRRLGVADPPERLSISDETLDGADFGAAGEMLSVVAGDLVQGWHLPGRELYDSRPVEPSPGSAVLGAGPGMVAVGTAVGTVVLYSWRNREAGPVSLQGMAGEAWSLAFSSDGRRLAVGGSEGTVSIWNLEDLWQSEKHLSGLGRRLEGHQDQVWSLALDEEGAKLVTGGRDGRLILWDAAEARRLDAPLLRHGAAVRGVALTAEILASVDTDGVFQLQGMGSNRGPLSRYDDDEFWTSLAIDPKQLRFALGRSDGAVFLVDRNRMSRGSPDPEEIRSSRLGSAAEGKAGPVWSVAFSPNGRLLASGTSNGSVILWDAESRRVWRTLDRGGLDLQVWSLAFRPDGEILASGDSGGHLVFHDSARWQVLGSPVRVSSESERGVWALAFSPDGRTLASGSQGSEDQLLLWDVATHQRVGSLAGHTRTVNGLAFGPNGRLFSASDDGSVIVWDTLLSSWRSRACRKANRNLTCEEWEFHVGNEHYRETCGGLPPSCLE